MSEESSFHSSLASTASTFGHFENPREQNYSSDSNVSTQTDNFTGSGDDSSKLRFERSSKEINSPEAPREKSLQEPNPIPDDRKYKKKSAGHWALRRIRSNSRYTEEEINGFVRTIERALYEDTTRRKLIPSSSRSPGLPVARLNSPELGCHCLDDLSLSAIRSMVLDQYCLVRSCEASLVRSDLDLATPLESPIESWMGPEVSADRRIEPVDRIVASFGDDEEPRPSSHRGTSRSVGSQKTDENRHAWDSCEDEIGEKSSRSCKLRDASSLASLLRHLTQSSCEEVEPFVIGHQGRSDLIGKWGDCPEIVDQDFSERDTGATSSTESEGLSVASSKRESLVEEKTLSCIRYDEYHDDVWSIGARESATQLRTSIKSCGEVVRSEKTNDKCGDRQRIHAQREWCSEIFDGACGLATDRFDNLKRFDRIGRRGVASLCRQLTRWTHCVTKTLCGILQNPHIVVQIPSFSYPKTLRNRAKMNFRSLQNTQFGRLSWLENEKAQVIYVCPNSVENDGLASILREWICTVRPDVRLDNLWIVNPKKLGNVKNVSHACSSGIENIFSNPRQYRRLRKLTAGRQAFVLPGVMQKKDVFVACELKVPIMGVSLKCQKRLILKGEFITLLKENNIDHPPSLEVNKFQELCSALARMIIEYPDHDTWLVKLNIGFGGCHTAVYSFHKTAVSDVGNECQCQLEKETKLCRVLAKILPTRMQLKTNVYTRFGQFSRDLERHGGIIQACPKYNYKTITLGIVLEHDTATPKLLATAEVIKFKDDIRSDVGYVVPQNIVTVEKLDELTNRIGLALRREGMVGFFGIDLVVFTNESNIQKVWIVDLDPHYTNLQSFNEWINFCLQFGASHGRTSGSSERDVTRENVREKSRGTEEIMDELAKTADRYSVASGKLWSNGLVRYSWNALINMCRYQGLYYDRMEKRGCMLCPIDPELHDICLISIYPTRQMAIRKFIEALKILHGLSIDKRKSIETNMLKLAREMTRTIANETGFTE